MTCSLTRIRYFPEVDSGNNDDLHSGHVGRSKRMYESQQACWDGQCWNDAALKEQALARAGCCSDLAVL
jgi:hypothetical protein